MATAVAPDVPGGVDRLIGLMFAAVAVRLAPPPKLTVSEWADKYRWVSSYSADPGQWVTDRTPYLREIMDVFCDPTVTQVVFMKCRRIGGTEAGQNVVGYFIDQDPSPILVVQPTVDDAKDYSKEQLGPMIEDTERLRLRVSASKSRDSGNTIQAKVYPGGGLYLVGANSPRGFRRRTARVIILEEVDGYPPSAGTEGDQVELAIGRATTFQHRRKVYINSTPTLKGFSRIETEFAASDQRRYHVPCPDCGHMQPLVWGQLKYADLEEPHYCCVACGSLIPEERKQGMVSAGRWIASRPGVAVVGFHINALYSPWVSWADLVTRWKAAQQDEGKMQVFINTELGEVYEERATGFDGLAGRPRWDGKVPAAVRLLTAGADTQEDRIEVVVRAWGPGEESWQVTREVLWGDTEDVKTWQQLDAVLARTWEREDGDPLAIDTLCIDSGGSRTDAVYRFVKPRFKRRVFATKGYSTPNRPLVSRRPSLNNKGRVRLFLVGTDTAKDVIYARLKSTVPSGPGVYHFHVSADDDYFEQLVSEQAKREYVNGRWVRRYILPQGARNEVLDCEVGAFVALELSTVGRKGLGTAAAKAGPKRTSHEAPASSEVPITPEVVADPVPVVQQLRRQFMPRRRGWVTDF